MENASEPEAPRMSIQTKDLIRYTNHTIHQKKNHAKPIQKFHHNSTHSQPTTKHLDTLPADSEAPRPTPFPSNHKETQPFLHAVQRSADGSSNSRETTQPHTPTPPLYPHALNLTARTATSTSRLEKPAGKACAVWRRLCRRGADFQRLRSQPPTKPRRQTAHALPASVQQLRIPDSIPGTGVRSPPPPSSHEKKNLL